MHQYHIQYQKYLNTWNLGDILVHSDLNKEDFVANLIINGYWINDKNWLSPGCIQNVVVVA